MAESSMTELNFTSTSEPFSSVSVDNTSGNNVIRINVTPSSVSTTSVNSSVINTVSSAVATSGAGSFNVVVSSVVNGSRDLITGSDGADLFVFIPENTTPIIDPQFADIITNFNASQGDKIGLVNGLSAEKDIWFETFDSNGDGSPDSTLVRLGLNYGLSILAIVPGSVGSTGITTLTKNDFLDLGANIPT